MENFILYNVSRARKRLVFEAMPVHVQGIDRGTDEMVAEMLRDLGIAQEFESWKLRHYFSDYLSDDRESDDWQVVWARTTEISVALKAPSDVDVDHNALTRTYARDKTWTGEAPQMFPALAVIVADLDAPGAIEKAKSAIEAWAVKKGQHVKAAAVEGHSNKLHIELGPFDEEFFANGAPEAAEIRQLIAAKGGTTNWNDRLVPERR